MFAPMPKKPKPRRKRQEPTDLIKKFNKHSLPLVVYSFYHPQLARLKVQPRETLEAVNRLIPGGTIARWARGQGRHYTCSVTGERHPIHYSVREGCFWFAQGDTRPGCNPVPDRGGIRPLHNRAWERHVERPRRERNWEGLLARYSREVEERVQDREKGRK